MKLNAIRWSCAILAVFALMAVSANGQQDFSNVQIKTNKISDNFYTLDGQGGTIGVLTGSDGIFMGGSQFAPLTEKIVAAIHAISPAQIKFMVNTHVHGDHTGGNENLGKIGVTILARDQLRARLEAPATGPKAAPAALPLLTYRGPLTFHMNGSDVQLIP